MPKKYSPAAYQRRKAAKQYGTATDNAKEYLKQRIDQLNEELAEYEAAVGYATDFIKNEEWVRSLIDDDSLSAYGVKGNPDFAEAMEYQMERFGYYERDVEHYDELIRRRESLTAELDALNSGQMYLFAPDEPTARPAKAKDTRTTIAPLTRVRDADSKQEWNIYKLENGLAYMQGTNGRGQHLGHMERSVHIGDLLTGWVDARTGERLKLT